MAAARADDDRCRRPARSSPRSARSRRRRRSWYASHILRPRPRAFPPAATRPSPQSPLASHDPSLRAPRAQTASTHLREGLLALCPAGGEETTLQDIIEACDAEHRRLGGDLADATEEDVRLLALFSTAAKCFLCRTWKTLDDVCVHAPSDELVIQVVRRVWLPLLADVKYGTTGTCALDDGTQRQVIDECVAALRWLSGGWGVSIASDLIDYALHHVFQDNVREVTGVLGEENLGEMRFEAAVELAAALFQLAVEMEGAIGSRNAVEGRSTTSSQKRRDGPTRRDAATRTGGEQQRLPTFVGSSSNLRLIPPAVSRRGLPSWTWDAWTRHAGGESWRVSRPRR